MDLSATPWSDANGASDNVIYDAGNNRIYLTGIAIPEPTTFVLVLAGLAGVVFLRRRR